MDFRQEVVVGKLDRLVHWVDKGIDETSNLVRDLGKKYQNVSQAILILNVEGFSLTRHACLRCKKNSRYSYNGKHLKKFFYRILNYNVICICIVGIPAILSIMVTYENYYPGLADKLIVINCKLSSRSVIRKYLISERVVICNIDYLNNVQFQGQQNLSFEEREVFYTQTPIGF
jgi:hypothetical protein